MRLHTLICIFGSIFVDHVTADGFDSDLPSPIKQLDAYNYEKTIKETKIILVEFFAPWVTVKITGSIHLKLAKRLQCVG